MNSIILDKILKRTFCLSTKLQYPGWKLAWYLLTRHVWPV